MQMRQVGRLERRGRRDQRPDRAQVRRALGVRLEAPAPRPRRPSPATAPGPSSGGAELKGYSIYGEAWVWLMGDDRIIGDQQGWSRSRYKKFGVRPSERPHGRGALRAPRRDADQRPGRRRRRAGLARARARRRSTPGELGVNYWYSKRFRATFNYVVNHFGGDDANVTLTALTSPCEQEFLFRLAVAL